MYSFILHAGCHIYLANITFFSSRISYAAHIPAFINDQYICGEFA